MSEFRGAYAGRILRVDLSNRSIDVEPLKREFVEAHIGGRGISSRLLYDEVVPGSDPFDPANPLIFSVGALFGTPVPAASRTTVAAKSPLSNFHGDAHSAGGFGASLRQAGYDAVVLTGRASEPVYLIIDDGEVK
ncbi:MAG: aldehyde ferredoxin oxidoreductase, partial [Chloroflexi bacterium]|nr:aldehyde ferredoxin oxidoreductase [Chloroflexota bacterium]